MDSLKQREYFRDTEAGIVIYCGDCREILPLLADKSVDLVLTDPPYNALDIGVNSRTYDSTPVMKLSDTDYKAFCHDWFQQTERISNGIIVSTGISNEWNYPPPKWVLIWNKPRAVAYNKTGGFNIWEPILIYGQVGRFTEDSYTSTPPNLLRGPEREHPCPKPVGLWHWLISPSKGSVLDPFLGSGTTAVVAKKLGRPCTGIELSEKYCAIAVKRLKATQFAIQQPLVTRKIPKKIKQAALEIL